ncbi:MAG TPA: stage II sporulation protein M [Fimbriimonadaceae bacterium]|nr:stage II sporulation protein M [Fimbriimonadaceae bacterium]
MNEVLFLKEREPDWQRLYVLTFKADVSPSQLSKDELHEFLQLYKRVSGDLALVRTRTNNRQLMEFLNDLTGKAYAAIYRPPRGPFLRAVAAGIRASAQTVRRLRWFVVASLLTFLLGLGQAYFLMGAAPQTREYFLPDEPGWKESFDSWKSGERLERTASESMQMSGFYGSNNPRVAIIGGAIGAGTFGIGSAYMLWSNGSLFGTLLHEMVGVGKGTHLIISVAPHGATEISGFILSGASGYRLGWALLVPGRRRRKDSLKAAGRDAIVLLTTSAIMMFMAAPVEGFFSFNPSVPDVGKILFAVISFGAWMVFWTGYGRTEDELERDEREDQDS